MLYLILALFSGIVGGLVVATLPSIKDDVRNTIVLLFSLLGAYFTWRVSLLVFAGQIVKVSGQLAGLSWSLNPDPLGAVLL